MNVTVKVLITITLLLTSCSFQFVCALSLDYCDYLAGYYLSHQGDFSRKGFQDVYLSYPKFHKCIKSKFLYAYYSHPSPIFYKDYMIFLLSFGDSLFLAVYDIRFGTMTWSLMLKEFSLENVFSPPSFILDGRDIYASTIFTLSGNGTHARLAVFVCKCRLFGAIEWSKVILTPYIVHLSDFCLWYVATGVSSSPSSFIFTYSSKLYVILTRTLFFPITAYVLDGSTGELLMVKSLNLLERTSSESLLYCALASISSGKLYLKTNIMPYLIACFSLPSLELKWMKTFRSYVCINGVELPYTPLEVTNYIVEDQYGRVLFPNDLGVFVYDGDGNLLRNVTLKSFPRVGCVSSFSHLLATNGRIYVLMLKLRYLYIMDRDFNVLRVVDFRNLTNVPSRDFVDISVQVTRNMIFIALRGRAFNGVMLFDFEGNLIWAKYIPDMASAFLAGNRIFIVASGRILIYEC